MFTRIDHIGVAVEDLDAAIKQTGKQQVIEQTLASFNVPVEVVDINVGPTVTQFGVRPGTLTRRGPGGDSTGFNFWVGQVGTQGRDFVRAQFVPSPEFQARVALVIAAGCLP